MGIVDLLLVDCMDKPFGPRHPPPDKRHAAYQSIFGRPGVSHHKPPQQQQPYQSPDKRSSYDTPYNHYPYQQPPYPSYPNEHQSLSRVNSYITHDPGLTPAQSYQAQVYNAPPIDWPRTTPAPPPPIQNGRPPSIDHDTNHVHEDDSLEVYHDESSSELPWARSEQTQTGTCLFPFYLHTRHNTPFSSVSSFSTSIRF